MSMHYSKQQQCTIHLLECQIYQIGKIFMDEMLLVLYLIKEMELIQVKSLFLKLETLSFLFSMIGLSFQIHLLALIMFHLLLLLEQSRFL